MASVQNDKNDKNDKNDVKNDTVDVENVQDTRDIFRKVHGDAAVDTPEFAARLSKFEREKLYDGHWSESSLDALEGQILLCEKAAAAHDKAARTSRGKHRMLMIPTLVAGTISGSLSYFLAGGDPCSTDGGDDQEGLKYSVAIMTSIVALLGGLGALYSFNTKMSEHIAAAGSYTNLARRGKLQMLLPNSLRGECEVVLTEMGVELANLTSTSPLL